MRPLALLALIAAAGCARPAAVPDGERGDGSVSERGLERLVHEEANRARGRAGREVLGRRGDLARVAERHSRDMAANDFFGHVGPDGRSPQQRARAAGVRCGVRQSNGSMRVGVNENLFQTWIALRVQVMREGATVRRIPHNRTEEQIAREVVEGWLGSPGHRRALLDRGARDHGIGVAVRRDGAIFVTQVIC